MELDIDFVRSQFPQCGDSPERVFCANAGGTYLARQVIDRMQNYNLHTRVQPYNGFSPSREAGQAMDQARRGWSEALNIGASELTFGPSTSMNSYVMAQACGASWKPGDEIIVTQQDHESNIGVWRRKAEEQGAVIREWKVDPESGLLDPGDLDEMLTEHTRWLFFTHCSNVMGTVNPVSEIVRKVRQQSAARVCVDAVAYAPHHICDLKALDVDMYLFSLYKVFGPHQGILYVNSRLAEELSGQSHYFIREENSKRYNPAGPQHAQIAACQGVLEYFDCLHLHHGGDSDDSPRQKMEAVRQLISAQETQLAAPLLDYLDRSPLVRLFGKSHCRDGDRAPTIAFRPQQKSSAEVAAALQAQNIGTENGDFYAPRAMQGLGIDPLDGVVRISLVHYNSSQEVERILQALERALAA